MKGSDYFYNPKLRPAFLAGGLLLFLFLQACSTYSSSRGYPPRSYSYQPQYSSYHRGHGYYDDRYYGNRYYGSYQPGWFISAGYPGAHYGSWGYGPAAYWPSHSYIYYHNVYYPYYDPWYYRYSSHYRHPHGYGAGYWPGNPYDRYGHRPYYGNTHSYRPPGQHQQPVQQRPEPVVIPRGSRGRGDESDEYNRRVAEELRRRETHQADRRSVTVVNEEQGLSRSVGVAPTQSGDQGMSISSRSDRKVRASRLEPVGTQTIQQQTAENYDARDGNQRSYSTPQPVHRPVIVIPIDSRRSSRGYTAPTETVRVAPEGQYRAASREGSAPVPIQLPRSEPVYRQAPARREPAYQQSPAPGNQQAYEQRMDSSNVVPRAERRQSRDAEREQERRDR